jgi:cobalamin biosynthesis protein CobD/CbiB
LNLAVYRLVSQWAQFFKKNQFLFQERVYGIICAILFAIAFGLLVWFLIIHGAAYTQTIIATILLGVMLALYVWDVQILQGDSSN